MNLHDLIQIEVRKIYLIFNKFKDNKWSKLILIKLLDRTSSFDVFRYELDFVTREKLLSNFVLIVILCFVVLSLKNFFNQHIKSSLANIDTFICINSKANKIANI